MNIIDILLRLSKITLGTDRMNFYAMICVSGMLTYGFYKAYQLKGLNLLFFFIVPTTTAHFYYQSADFVGQLIFGLTRAHPMEFFVSSFDIPITLFIYLISTSFVILYRKYLNMKPLLLICILWAAIKIYVITIYGVSNIYVVEGNARAILYGTIYIPGWTTLAISYFWFWK